MERTGSRHAKVDAGFALLAVDHVVLVAQSAAIAARAGAVTVFLTCMKYEPAEGVNSVAATFT